MKPWCCPRHILQPPSRLRHPCLLLVLCLILLPSSLRADRSADPVLPIPLAPPLDAKRAEISGLTWHRDRLVLLPQYPDRFGPSSEGRLFAIAKQRLLSFVQRRARGPIEARPVRFDSGGLEKKIPGFEGFEAVSFCEDRVYLTVEARPEGSMTGYIVSGEIDAAGSSIRLAPESLRQIPSQSGLGNMAEEALTIADGRLLSFHEANGQKVNPSPAAHAFTLSLRPLPDIPFPNLEYRLTDATRTGRDNRFWVINFFFPGDRKKLRPAGNASSDRPVEQLVELEHTPQTIRLTDSDPIALRNASTPLPRNWEGLARLEDRGFFLVTDTFPATILGFIPRPR